MGIILFPSLNMWVDCLLRQGWSKCLLLSQSWLMQYFQLACHLFPGEMEPSCAVRAWTAKYLLPCEGGTLCQSCSGHLCGTGKDGPGVTLPPECVCIHHKAQSCYKTTSHQEIPSWDGPLWLQGLDHPDFECNFRWGGLFFSLCAHKF